MGDVDSDGAPDILFYNTNSFNTGWTTSNVQIYRSGGGTTFVPASSRTSGMIGDVSITGFTRVVIFGDYTVRPGTH